MTFILFIFLEAVDCFVEETGIRSFFRSLQDGSITQVLFMTVMHSQSSLVLFRVISTVRLVFGKLNFFHSYPAW